MNGWLADHYIEIFGAVTGILYVYLEIKQNIWLWPLGIITSAVYIWVFYNSLFYADMGLQWYYLFISIYGWYWWRRGTNRKAGEEPGSDGAGSPGGDPEITRLDRKTGIWLALVSATLFILIRYILIRYTDSPIPGWDSFTTAISIVATWMLARKILEHWILWIVADIVSMVLYIYKGLFPTVVLFGVYTLMAFAGYRLWREESRRGGNQVCAE